jgi:hypothetical protein
VGTSGEDVLVGTARADVIVGKGGNDDIRGRGGGDLICAGGGNDFVSGDGGSDRIVGNGGSDILSGAGGADELEGAAGVDVIAGGPGDDHHSGGGDLDLVAFLASPQPVYADLVYGVAQGEGDDTLTGVEALYGSDFDDTLYGDGGMNAFFGGPGDDDFYGDGGSDFVSYQLEPEAMQISLGGGWATDGLETDGLYSIENALGTPFDDSLSGSADPNFLSGEEGDDIVNGEGEGDICYGETVHGCIETLPTTSEPPQEVESVVQATPRTRQLQSEKAPASARATGNGSLTCPMLTGTAVMTYPSWSGYGYWAWRYSYPFPVGAWNYGPWMYFNGARWIVHYDGIWYNASNQSAWPGGHSTAIEAWYFHYDSQAWYEIGECFTQTTHLIPGLTIVPQ